MEKVQFRTLQPCDHIARALDVLRTMGFELETLDMRREDRGHYEVLLGYQPRGQLSHQTFLSRLARLRGLQFLGSSPRHPVRREGQDLEHR